MTDARDDGAPPTPDDIRAQLRRILSSPGWTASARRSDLLRFLVAETLAGRGDRLRGVAIAVDVFGRAADFDPQIDAIVRVEARRLRRDLDSYYGGEGRHDLVLITVPKGRYVPHFAWNRAPAANPEPKAAEPVEAASLEETARGPRRPPRFPVALLALVLVLAAGGAATLLYLRSATVEEEAYRGPAVFVREFEASAQTNGDAELAAGLRHELMTDLMGFPTFRLYSEQASFEASSGSGHAAREISARYIVDGKVRTDSDEVFVAAQLTDTTTGEILWSRTFLRALRARNLFAVQATMAAEIASAIGQTYGPLHEAVLQRVQKSVDPSMRSYRCVLEAHRYRRTFVEELYAPTRRCLEDAVTRDPDYAQAWAMLAYLRLDAVRMGYDPQADLGPALAAARRAEALDPKNVEALKALSLVQHYGGDYARSRELAQRAVELNPHDPDALAHLGWRLAMRGDIEQGGRYLQRAIERTLRPPPTYFLHVAVVNYMRGDYAHMLDAAERAATDGSAVSQSLLAVAHAKLGNDAAATAALRLMAKRWPLLARDPRAAYGMHRLDATIIDALIEGLEDAGLRRVAADRRSG